MEFNENAFQPKNKIDFVFVDILTKIDTDCIIYTGIAKSYMLSNDGGLSSILLSGAKRRLMSDDPEQIEEATSQERYYKIPGELLLIPNSSIININFRYVDLDDEKV
ncbi:MAG: hypothetical protein M3Q95_06130 [Bacteroidota bacterium]|nr:hypothetical protein [Bacteroidota bacterium]